MDIKNISLNINEEINSILNNLDEKQLNKLKKSINKAERIFVAGAGRSLLMLKAFAMRLMHIGYKVYVVGETTTPAIGKDDLLIIASGSGNTSTMVCIGEKCKKYAAEMFLITTNLDSKLGNLTDNILHIKTTTSKSSAENKSIQPGGNTYEQALLIICDAIIIGLMPKKSIKKQNEKLMQNHANLE